MRRRRGTVEVQDRAVGSVLFPAADTVMAPLIAATGVWEPAQGRWLRRHVRSDSTFLDVGANVGYFCLIADDAAPGCSIVAVEPGRQNFDLLRANLRSHGVRARTLRAAAGDVAGEARLHLSETNTGDHRLAPPGNGRGRRTETVACVVLDDVRPPIEPDVVMIDTQGWDHRVLRGMTRILSDCRPIVLMEFTPAWLRDAGEDPSAVLDWIADQGYLVGIVDAGAIPGRWPWERIVRWCDEREFGTLELWPAERPFSPDATPSDGFWAVESDGSSLWWWMGDPRATVSVRGPARARVVLSAVLAPAPEAQRSHVTVSGRPLEVVPGTRIEVPVALDAAGTGDVPIEAPESGRGPGDFRDLHLLIQDPAVTLADADAPRDIRPHPASTDPAGP